MLHTVGSGRARFRVSNVHLFPPFRSNCASSSSASTGASGEGGAGLNLDEPARRGA